MTGGTGSSRQITMGTGWEPVLVTTERPTGLLITRYRFRDPAELDKDQVLFDRVDRGGKR